MYTEEDIENVKPQEMPTQNVNPSQEPLIKEEKNMKVQQDEPSAQTNKTN